METKGQSIAQTANGTRVWDPPPHLSRDAAASLRVRRGADAPSTNNSSRPSLHRTLIVESILVVLDDQRDGVERVAAVRVLGGVLQVEILNRNVVIAISERAT